jgi:uncharacterized repeat protein (TIGR03806 family)
LRGSHFLESSFEKQGVDFVISGAILLRMKALSRHLGAIALFAIGAVTISNALPLERRANTSLTNMPSVPPSLNFTATNAFPGLVFTNPIVITTPPGETNRLFVVEKRGRIIVITNLAVPTKSMFMDITGRVTGSDTSVGGEEGLLGLAFHPGYATNGFFYVFYTGNDNTTGISTRHDILSRFSVNALNPNQGNSASELKLIRQRDDASNHNAGDLQFGPDGYLYVSLGDEGGGDGVITGTPSGNVQRITNDFFSAVMRVDVDKRPGGLTPNTHVGSTVNYAVPPDNPFVGATNFNGFTINPAQVRTEFWAVGLRNPWRINFDPPTGDLYCADVGQGTLEEIDLITKGKNYGWTYFEGTFQRTNNATLAVVAPGFVHTPPVIQYGRTNGIAVVGGFVYRGTKMSQLYGAYIYGDYGSGRIWAMKQSGGVVTQNALILTDNLNNSSLSGLSTFGPDPRDGYILYGDEQNATDGSIKRIVPSSSTGTPIPPLLSQAGVFSNLTTLETFTGIVPYDLNVPFWSDNALKTRWFSVPNTNLDITFSREGNYTFPTGSVWIKHFELEITNGVPESRRRLETRVLIKNSTAGGGYGVTYRWADPPTNATLVAEEGFDEPLVIDSGGGILRTQVWHYPSRSECLQCHTMVAGFALGFNTPQLNRDFDYDGAATNQIAALSDAGYFNTNVTGRHTLRSLVHPTNELASLEARARSYLAANCVQCHQPGGTSHALWDARLTTQTADAGLVNGALFAGGSSTNDRVLVPGSVTNSMLLTRISTRGPGQMPPLSTSLVDIQGVALLSAWVTNDLPSFQTFAQWQLAWFGSTNSPDASALSDPDGDRALNQLEFLTGTNPTNALDAWKISIVHTNGDAFVQFPQIANRAFEIQSSPALAAATWSPLDVPENAPFFAISNRAASVTEPVLGTNRYYRVRIFAP